MNIVCLELQSPLYDAGSEIMHVVEEGRNHPPGHQRSGISLATAKSLLGLFPECLSRSDHHVRSRLGFSEFGDLGRDYEDGFQEGVVPKGEIGHVGYHVTRKMTSEDYTSRRDLESSETLARDLET